MKIRFLCRVGIHAMEPYKYGRRCKHCKYDREAQKLADECAELDKMADDLMAMIREKLKGDISNTHIWFNMNPTTMPAPEVLDLSLSDFVENAEIMKKSNTVCSVKIVDGAGVTHFFHGIHYDESNRFAMIEQAYMNYKDDDFSPQEHSK